MLHPRRFARPSTLILAMLLGIHGSTWAQQPPVDMAPEPDVRATTANRAPLPLEELRHPAMAMG